MSRVRLKQLAQDGATDGEVAKWNNTAGVWEAGTAASGGISTGTAAARPASPADGTFYYATDTQALSYYDVSAWEDVGILVDDVTIEIDGTSGKLQLIDAGTIATTKLSATGTKDSTTFLRGDDTWAAPAGGGGASDNAPACFTASGSDNITNTADAKMTLNTTQVSDTNYSLATGTVTVTAAGTYTVSYTIPIQEDSTAGSARGSVDGWVTADSTIIPQSYSHCYVRETAGGTGLATSFVVTLAASDDLELWARQTYTNQVDISSWTGRVQLSIFKLGTG